MVQPRVSAQEPAVGSCHQHCQCHLDTLTMSLGQNSDGSQPAVRNPEVSGLTDGACGIGELPPSIEKILPAPFLQMPDNCSFRALPVSSDPLSQR